jgi:flagellar hook-basal body protein
VFHGPALASQTSVSLRPGDQVSFDWKALAGGDAYDVIAYLLNTDDGTTVPLFDATGNSSNAETPWRSESVTMTQAGNYSFIFVAGSYDLSGGQALGGSLSIDNISIRSATPNPDDIRTIQNVSGPRFVVDQAQDVVRVRTELAPEALGTHQPIAVMQFWGGRNIDALVTNPVSGQPTFESKVTLSGKVKTEGGTAQSSDPDLVFELDLTGTQNYATPFSVQEMVQDGRTVGLLNNVTIGDDGKIVGVYGDGRTYLAGQLVLVGFENADGLTPAGGNAFKATAMSGGEVHASAVVGKPGSKSLGGIQAGAIESSNVDMGNELVDLLVQQRLYTANAQSFRAFDQALSTTMGLMGR